MESILAKLRSITLSNIHTLLDHARNCNTVGEHEQYCRDLQTAHDQLDDQAAASRARKSSLERQVTTGRAHTEALDGQIDDILLGDNPNKAALAAKLQMDLDSEKAQVALNEQELQTVKAQVEQYDSAVSRLAVVSGQANAKLRSLRAQAQTAEIQERAARALEGIAVGDAPDTSAAEQRIAERSAVATNRLDRSLGRVTEAVGGVTSSEASAAASIEARMRRLSAASAGQPAPSAT